jgi:hypothetical protein
MMIFGAAAVTTFIQVCHATAYAITAYGPISPENDRAQGRTLPSATENDPANGRQRMSQNQSGGRLGDDSDDRLILDQRIHRGME